MSEVWKSVVNFLLIILFDYVCRNSWKRDLVNTSNIE